MREDDLRKILLVKAVEESDRDGTLVPAADRAAAGREAMRNAPAGAEPPEAETGALSRRSEQLLAARTRTVLDRIVARHPFVAKVLALLGPSNGITAALVVLGLLFGVGLSALDGSRRINVLAFPLLGVVAWNLAVYVALLVMAVRGKRAGATPLRSGLAAIGSGFASRVIRRSRGFNAPLADALQSFAREWYDAARPLLLARAARGFHLAAAAVGVGLVAGIYMRGIAFDYQAGWESTFLDAPRARALLGLMYGPAAWITGIAIPDAAHLEAMRWRGAAGGEPAARWIHLMAATALIYVIVPRAVLALAAAMKTMRLALRAPVPASLTAYFRAAFAQVEGAIARASALVMPYACELSPGALARLIAWLPGTAGGPIDIEARDSTPYGEEDRYLAGLAERGADRADILVLPFNMASTPEAENHGRVIAGVRDWLAASRPQARLMVVVDEAPYAQRMEGNPQRLAERREAWRAFVESHGVKPSFASLAP